MMCNKFQFNRQKLNPQFTISNSRFSSITLKFAQLSTIPRGHRNEEFKTHSETSDFIIGKTKVQSYAIFEQVNNVDVSYTPTTPTEIGIDLYISKSHV